MMTIPLVQFGRYEDWLADLDASGYVDIVYYELIDQRLGRDNDIGIGRWQLMSVLRAVVNDTIVRVASLSITHGRAATLLRGETMGPLGDNEGRWGLARAEHEQLIEAVIYDLAELGAIGVARRGVLHIDEDVPLMTADGPRPPQPAGQPVEEETATPG